MEQVASWEANRLSASQEIATILWNLEFHYLIHKSQPSEPDRSSPWSHILLPEDPSYIILASTPGSSRLSLFLGFSHQNPVHTSLLVIHATCPNHLTLLDLITRAIFAEELLIMKFAPCPCCLVPLRPKYSPQHPILERHQTTFHSQCERPSFSPVKK